MPLADLAQAIDFQPVVVDAEVQAPGQPAEQFVDITALEGGHRAAVLTNQVMLMVLLDWHIRVLVGRGDLPGRAPVHPRQPMVVVQQVDGAIHGCAADRPGVAADILEKLLRAEWLVVLSDAIENGAARAGNPPKCRKGLELALQSNSPC